LIHSLIHSFIVFSRQVHDCGGERVPRSGQKQQPQRSSQDHQNWVDLTQIPVTLARPDLSSTVTISSGVVLICMRHWGDDEQRRGRGLVWGQAAAPADQGVTGTAVSSPSRVWGGIPAANDFSALLSVERLF